MKVRPNNSYMDRRAAPMLIPPLAAGSRLTQALKHKESIMNSILKVITCMLAISIISGCASTVLESKPYKTYTIGRTVTANVGMPFLEAQTGTITKIKHWVGVANSPDGWKIDDIYSSDFIKKELVYSGKSGSTIEIGYREYRSGLAAPAFYQSVKYDLNESNIIGFQNFQFKVNSADNSSISVVIIRD